MTGKAFYTTKSVDITKFTIENTTKNNNSLTLQQPNITEFTRFPLQQF